MTKSVDCSNFLQSLEPVSMLKSSAAITLSNFDKNWFADWVAFSQTSFMLLLLRGL